ncbi:type IV pilus biogenesis/stability protein PilW [Legionella rowbothamii]|uniref:type IV pilus biogenesis/stability protein PilW n=1 Tax=Legionella rowbothamii TaxID=96229 RepID=UPI001056A02D
MVLNVRYFSGIALCLLLQGCMHNNNANDRQTLTKPDLSKASAYNVQLGLGYLKQGDRPRAKKKLLTALEQEPRSADANSAMAYYLEQTSEPAQAKMFYLKALSLTGNAGAQLNNYGAFLCRQGNYKEAEYYFLKAAADLHYVHTAGAYENAGLCALSANQIEHARPYFIKALNQDPSRKVSFYELVKIEATSGRNTSAYALVKKHADLVLNDRTLLFLAKEVAEKAGQYEIAAMYKQTIKKMDPNLDIGGANNEYNNHA